VKQRLMWIAWPAFLVAGVVEMVVFAFVDPQQLHGPDGAPLELSRQTVYALAFFAFWGATMASSALTTLLARSPFEVNRCPYERHQRPTSCPAEAGTEARPT
jgi:hypothetical protein